MSNPYWDKCLVDISNASAITQLRSIREAEQTRLDALLSTSQVNEVVETLNELHDAIIRQTVQLAESEMARLGRGAPPVPYTYLLFGSGGRSEQTIYSDQDSGILYTDPPDNETAEQCRTYFTELADTAVRFLRIVGYPPCEGNVVASNPEWCLSLNQWKRKMDCWFTDPSWENVRYLLIIADARPIAGEHELGDKLKDYFFIGLLTRPVIIGRMLENTLRHKVLIGFFGQLLRQRYGADAGSLDIKYGAYIPMVNAIRLFSVDAGIREAATLKRIDALRGAGVLTRGEAEETSDAFSFFLKMRMLTTGVNIEGDMVGTGKVPSEQLTKETIMQLKTALKAGRKIQLKLQKEMKGRFGGR